MGQPDRCQHAVHLINELVHTAQVLFLDDALNYESRQSNHTFVKHRKTSLNSSACQIKYFESIRFGGNTRARFSFHFRFLFQHDFIKSGWGGGGVGGG